MILKNHPSEAGVLRIAASTLAQPSSMLSENESENFVAAMDGDDDAPPIQNNNHQPAAKEGKRRRRSDCCLNSPGSHTTINGEKKEKISAEVEKKPITQGGSAPNPQHNNQMVELGACGGGRMDRDHVHDP